MVLVLLKPDLENFEHYFTSVWDECNCVVVWAFFGISFLWDCNENWPFPVLWPLLSVARGHQRADTLKPYSQKSSQSNHTRTTALSNSMKLSHAREATQDRWVMVEMSDRLWSTGEANGKPLQYSCLENSMNSIKKQKDRTLKGELPRLVGAQYATGDQWRNNSRKNEGLEPKQKQHPVVDGTGDRIMVWCCKEQYSIGTWNIRSMNQGKLEVVKQEMAKSECRHSRNQWTKMDWNGWI